MAYFDPRNAHFQAANKVFSKEHTQPIEEEKCLQQMTQGAEAFEISEFLVSQEEFDNSCKSEDSCIQRIHCDHNSTVIQTQEPPETINCRKSSRKRKADGTMKYAFVTRSETDILQDGYKWRKYGRKFLKSSPNPRNYYRCSNINCDVKKTVDRNTHDKGIVITTYMGQHNHESPTIIYYIGRHEPDHASAAMPN